MEVRARRPTVDAADKAAIASLRVGRLLRIPLMEYEPRREQHRLDSTVSRIAKEKGWRMATRRVDGDVVVMRLA